MRNRGIEILEYKPDLEKFGSVWSIRYEDEEYTADVYDLRKVVSDRLQFGISQKRKELASLDRAKLEEIAKLKEQRSKPKAPIAKIDEQLRTIEDSRRQISEDKERQEKQFQTNMSNILKLHDKQLASIKRIIEQRIGLLKNANISKPQKVVIRDNKLFVMKKPVLGQKIFQQELSIKEKDIVIVQLPIAVCHLHKHNMRMPYDGDGIALLYTRNANTFHFVFEDPVSKAVVEQFVSGFSQAADKASKQSDLMILKEFMCRLVNPKYFELVNVEQLKLDVRIPAEEKKDKAKQVIEMQISTQSKALQSGLKAISKESVDLTKLQSISRVFRPRVSLIYNEQVDGRGVMELCPFDQNQTVFEFLGFDESSFEKVADVFHDKCAGIRDIHNRYIEISLEKCTLNWKTTKQVLRDRKGRLTRLRALQCSLEGQYLIKMSTQRFLFQDLVELDLSGNPIGTGAVEILTMATKLHTLKLNSCEITVEPAKKFFGRRLAGLVHGELDNNRFGSDSFSSLKDAIGTLVAEQLKHLSLSGNRLSDEQFCAFLKSTLPVLEVIKVNGNLIRRGLDSLVNGAEKSMRDGVSTNFPKLRELFLEHNMISMLDQRAGLHIFASLRKIYLHGNPIVTLKPQRLSQIIQLTEYQQVSAPADR